ncbi:hypothetical protein OSTOST_04727 [Ostertagia ostertagi]
MTGPSKEGAMVGEAFTIKRKFAFEISLVAEQKKFISELTAEVNTLSVVPRTEKQVEQKIRDEIKILKRYGNAVMKERSKTGGGRAAVFPRLTAAQRRAFEALREKPRLTGVEGGIEVGQRQKRRRSDSPDSPTDPQSRFSLRKRLPSAQEKVPTREEILKQELENQLLKKELILKKTQLVDLKLQQWSNWSWSRPFGPGMFANTVTVTGKAITVNSVLQWTLLFMFLLQ